MRMLYIHLPSKIRIYLWANSSDVFCIVRLANSWHRCKREELVRALVRLIIVLHRLRSTITEKSKRSAYHMYNLPIYMRDEDGEVMIHVQYKSAIYQIVHE